MSIVVVLRLVVELVLFDCVVCVFVPLTLEMPRTAIMISTKQKKGHPSLLVLLLGLGAAHALVPLSLADARLVVRRRRLDVLHDGLDGAARLVPVAVHYIRSS